MNQKESVGFTISFCYLFLAAALYLYFWDSPTLAFCMIATKVGLTAFLTIVLFGVTYLATHGSHTFVITQDERKNFQSMNWPRTILHSTVELVVVFVLLPKYPDYAKLWLICIVATAATTYVFSSAMRAKV